MIQEDKELLLKDLSARLLYNVIVDYEGHIYVLNEIDPACKDINYITVRIQDVERTMCAKSIMIEEIKPYLRPISSMTDEEMDRLFDILQIDKDGKDEDWIKINDVYGIKFFFPTGKWIEDVAEAYDYLYSIHIDFRGLIREGLAIEVTPENNPYKDDPGR